MRHLDPEHINPCKSGRECLLQEFKLFAGGWPHARDDARDTFTFDPTNSAANSARRSGL